jgi:aquaporin Z
MVAEAVGTFFLVLIGPGTVMVDAFSDGAVGLVGIALAFGFVVSAMIYALGPLSGAHINPAVTLAFWSVRRFPPEEVPRWRADDPHEPPSRVTPAKLASSWRLG